MSKAPTDERNFRSTYYEKVGCRSVEEKKSLNILLKDNPLNKIKLKQFCLSFTVPSAQRSLLWNLILGVLPTYPESREYVMAQRVAVYDDLNRAVQVMRYVTENTPETNVLYKMWLLERKMLHPDRNFSDDHRFLAIADVLLHVFDNTVEVYEVYWIAKGFYEFTSEIKSEFPKLKELTYTLLEKEDNQLYKHFMTYDIISNLPLEKWYTSCFAGTVSESALIRIWDKICGGSRKIIVFVLLVSLKTLRLRLLRCNNSKDIQDIIEKKKEDQDDLIVNKAIESWQNNKSHNEIMVHRKDN